MGDWVLMRAATLRSELHRASIIEAVLRKLPPFPYGERAEIQMRWWACYMQLWRLVNSIRFSVTSMTNSK